MFITDKPLKFSISEKQKGLLIDDKFNRDLNSLSVPIKKTSNKTLYLTDVFVYPDLELISESTKNPKYVDSKSILDDYIDKKVIIEGDSQSGKTSLLKKYFLDFYSYNNFPLLISGKSIKNFDLDSILRKAVKIQYGRGTQIYESFVQTDRSKKILLIENFDKSNLNSSAKETLLKKFDPLFATIIVSTGEAVKVNQITENEKVYSDYDHFKIIPLGYLKRNMLIEKWIRIG